MRDRIGYGIPYLSFESFDETNLTVNAFSTRTGGVSSGYAASLNFGGTVNDAPDTISWT